MKTLIEQFKAACERREHSHSENENRFSVSAGNYFLVIFRSENTIGISTSQCMNGTLPITPHEFETLKQFHTNTAQR